MAEQRPCEEQLARFREQFRITIEEAENITTERTTILRDPCLRTDVSRLWADDPPGQVHNPVPPEIIGTYRPWDKRKCVTADMEVIRAFYEILKREPPSLQEAGPREFLYFCPDQISVGIVTAGGVAPGLNTVVHSLVCRHQLYGTRRIYGFRDGFRGIYGSGEDDPLLLDQEMTRPWIHHGGTGLRTLRDDHADVRAIVDRLQKMEIKILYVVGGDGSLTAAHEIWKEIQKRGIKISVAGVPKTMDNDIRWVWQSFGFTTAVAEATRTINAVHEEAESNNRICVVRLFGRRSGFVAANAALASGEVDAVLIPEESPIDMDVVVTHLEPVVKKNHHAMVVVAEGIGKSGGGPTPDDVFNALETRFKDMRPNRYATFLNEPRHAIRAVPAIPPDQIYCRRLADLAVDNALAGFTDFMISWWLTEYVLVPLDLVVGQIKQVPIGGIFWKEVRNSTGQPCFRVQRSKAKAQES